MSDNASIKEPIPAPDLDDADSVVDLVWRALDRLPPDSLTDDERRHLVQAMIRIRATISE
tara:strand:+ start:353 stop:532 length:180 start_codon:yes stop_codon:yes gene_type:complete